MTKEEAVEIATAFWLSRKETPILKIIAHFREEKNWWHVLIHINPKDDEDFVAIIVDAETKKARIFGLL